MKRWAVMLPLLLLSSCLLQRVLIAKLDTIIEYRVSSLMQLYIAQDRVLEKDVAAYLNAQKAIAPRIIELVKSINLNLPDDGKRVVLELLQLYRDLEVDFRRLLIKHMLTLDADQRKYFYAKMKEQIEETTERLQKDRTEDYHDRIEFFIGEITEDQQKMLRPHELIFLDRDRERLLRRQRFQNDLRAILESKTADREALLTERFLRHQRESFSNNAHLEKFLADLVRSLNKDQREHLETKRKEILEMVAQFAQTTYE